MKVVFIDLFSGVSGDMLLSAFIDAGMPLDYINKNIRKVLPEYEFSISSIEQVSFGISGKKIDIIEKPLNKRNYLEIVNLIEKSLLNQKIKTLSLKILHFLAKAESKIHGIPLEKVHFHEIGAIDTIIDIIGVSSSIDFFNIEDVFISPIPIGEGEINCTHGIYPNPAPATLELLKGFKINKININGELSTPTGVAILKGLNARNSKLPVFEIENIGYGFGKNNLKDRANFLRILIGNLWEDEILNNSYIYEIEFNVDDMTGEEIGFFIREIFKFNIKDIQCISTITKKNRPGYLFKIITDFIGKDLLQFIFEYSSTSGVRFLKKERIILDRIFENKEINGKKIRKKIFKSSKLEIFKSKFEFDDIEGLLKSP